MSDRLREALDELLDDYFATHGPNGYPQPMPRAWRVVQDWLAGSVVVPAPTEYATLDVERLRHLAVELDEGLVSQSEAADIIRRVFARVSSPITKSALADLQRYSLTTEPDGSAYMELDPDGRYVLAEDVEALL